MEYFKVNDVFQDFFFYVKSNMEPSGRHKLCIAYKDIDESQDIYIATADQDIINLIKGYEGLHTCDPPMFIMDDPSTWMFRGNRNLWSL
jgi:hypothetical protein